eukprot:88286-Chlamydomonas_euryale.AAC.2
MGDVLRKMDLADDATKPAELGVGGSHLALRMCWYLFEIIAACIFVWQCLDDGAGAAAGAARGATPESWLPPAGSARGVHVGLGRIGDRCVG